MFVSAVPASDEKLANALHEFSRNGITSAKVIKQYLLKDLGIEMSYVFLLTVKLSPIYLNLSTVHRQSGVERNS